MVVAAGVSTHSASWIRVGGQLEEQVDSRGVQEPRLFPEQMHLITNLLPDSDREIEANEQKTTVSFTHTKDTVSSLLLLNVSGYKLFSTSPCFHRHNSTPSQFLNLCEKPNARPREISTKTDTFSSHVHACPLPL